MINLNPSVGWILKVLLVFNLACFLLSFVSESMSWFLHTNFNLDRESNIPTWFSSMLLFTGAFSGILIMIRARTEKRKSAQIFWLVFAGVFVLLSMDEIAQFHEIFSIRLKDKNPWIWVAFYAPFAGIFFLYLAGYLTRSMKEGFGAKVLILGGLCLFAAGGMGVELLGHLGRLFHVISENFREPLIRLEESLEILGLTLFATGVLQALSDWYMQNNTFKK